MVVSMYTAGVLVHIQKTEMKFYARCPSSSVDTQTRCRVVVSSPVNQNTFHPTVFSAPLFLSSYHDTSSQHTTA
jgi:hypothetical protein